MNPLAQELNEKIKLHDPHVYEMLSDLGKALYFPKGILSQTAEAKAKATRYNATIGIATENGGPMHLGLFDDLLPGLEPADLYPYAPPAGKPALRQAWREHLIRHNPSLQGKKFGLPIATNALTHGLSIAADLFAGPGDTLVLPDKYWGNYNLTFGVRRGATVKTHRTFDDRGRYDVGALEAALGELRGRKAIVLLNFPNNPTGYTPGEAEAAGIVSVLKNAAEAGTNLVVILDDAYFGLFYEDSIKESLFGRLAGLHPRILPVKVDGATKEEFVWGFLVGFITFAAGSDETLAALEAKATGCIRGTISTGPHPSQTLVLKALQSPLFETQRKEKEAILRERAAKVKSLLDSGKYGDAWEYYPFNSGYFMCLKLNGVDAEALRTHLLEAYGVGTISIGSTDLRVAFSCVDLPDIEPLFDLIYQGYLDLRQKS